MSKELEAFDRVINVFPFLEINETTNYTLEDLSNNTNLIREGLQRLESIDNTDPSKALKCFDNMQQRIASNISTIEYTTIKQALLKSQEQEKLLKSGDLSDGYHTFNQLYYQRCILFASLVRLNKDKSWKSFKHSDEKYCFDSNGEWFIVGIDTPIGSYTYHYEKKYWDLFECQELECAKEWDGHTEEDVTRLLSLPNEQEKVLRVIKEKCIGNANLKMVKELANYSEYLRLRRFLDTEDDVLTEEEFDLLKRYFNE